jgi:energy-coupling factor transport system permease protein
LIWSAFIVATALFALLWSSLKKSDWTGLRLYGLMASTVIVIRLVFRLVFSQGTAGQVLLDLPTISVSAIGGELRLLGPVSTLALVAGLTDGLRLAAIILSVGMAATIASPRRLLKGAPASLYEFATALTIAINLAPQLIASLQRIRRARRLRGEEGGIRLLTSALTATIDDALALSLSLAASMESRGFGRTGAMRRRTVLAAKTATYLGLATVAIGVFAILVSGSGMGAGLLAVAIGTGLLATAIRLNGIHQVRSSFLLEETGLSDMAARILLCAFLGLIIAARVFPQPGLDWLR